MRTFSELQDSTLAEIGGVLELVSEDEYREFCAGIAAAGRIVASVWDAKGWPCEASACVWLTSDSICTLLAR